MKIWRAVAVGFSLLFLLNQANALQTDVNSTSEVTTNNKASNATKTSNIITSFAKLAQAVDRGDDVRAIVHFDNCEILGLHLHPEILRRLGGASTRFNFTHYFHGQERVNNVLIDTVATSMDLFIQSPTGEVLSLSGSLSVFEDNSATLHLNFLDPALLQQRFILDWICNISSGEDNNGLVLYNFY